MSKKLIKWNKLAKLQLHDLSSIVTLFVIRKTRAKTSNQGFAMDPRGTRCTQIMFHINTLWKQIFEISDLLYSWIQVLNKIDTCWAKL